MSEEIKKIYDHLKDVYVEDVWSMSDRIVAVSVRGDWKHDHLRSDWFMSEIGYSKLSEKTTEEDGSDWYCSDHFYYKEVA